MNYEQRISAVKAWMKKDILTRFTPPSGIEPTIAVGDVVEAVNSNLPVTDRFDYLLEQLTQHIVRNSKSRTLPTAKDFITSCAAVTQSHGAGATVPNSTPSYADHYKITERRVRKGEPIGDSWLTDLGMERLFENTSLTLVDLKPYIVAHKRTKSAT